MIPSLFTDQLMKRVLLEIKSGVNASEICRKYGISQFMVQTALKNEIIIKQRPSTPPHTSKPGQK